MIRLRGASKQLQRQIQQVYLKGQQPQPQKFNHPTIPAGPLTTVQRNNALPTQLRFLSVSGDDNDGVDDGTGPTIIIVRSEEEEEEHSNTIIDSTSTSTSTPTSSPTFSPTAQNRPQMRNPRLPRLDDAIAARPMAPIYATQVKPSDFVPLSSTSVASKEAKDTTKQQQGEQNLPDWWALLIK